MLTESQLRERIQSDDGALDHVIETQREDEEERRRTVEDAFNSGIAAAEGDDDLEAARPFRDELESLYPGQKASEIVKGFLSMDAEMRADPVNGAHKVAETYSRGSRFGDPAKPEKIEGPGGTIGIKLPSGKITYVHEGTIAHTAALAMTQTAKDHGEVDQLREMQKLLAKRYPGLKFSDALRKVRDFDVQANANPYKAAARLAASYGMPLSDEQAQAQQSLPAVNEHIRQVRDAEFPFLRGRDKDIREVLSSGGIGLTGDIRQDLTSVQEAVRAADTLKAEVKALQAKYPDFDKLKPAMTKLLNEGKAKSATEAYTKAKAQPKNSVRQDIAGAMRQHKG